MGLFNNLIKDTSEGENSSKMNWTALTEDSQISSLVLQSITKPALIFKHSTRCGISRMALKNFEREYDLTETDVELYLLDVLNYRAISNEISTKFNVQHQSPQVLIIKNEQVIYHDSHYQIGVDTIKEVLFK